MTIALAHIATVFIDLSPLIVQFLAGVLILLILETLWLLHERRVYRATGLAQLEEERNRREEATLQAIATEPEPEPLVDFAK